MNVKVEQVKVRVHRLYGDWDWADDYLGYEFNEFMDITCRAAYQHGKNGLPYDGKPGKVRVAVFDDDDIVKSYKEVEGVVDNFNPWNHF
jgi:hypothetical protein